MKWVIVFLSIFVLLLVIIVMGIILLNKKNFVAKEKFFIIKINNTNILVKAVISQKEKEKGLSGRDDLGENQGMLFVYDKPGFYEFWMKNMKYPIDIIWIDSAGQIIDMAQNIPVPDDNSELITYISSQPAQYILEVNAGFIKGNNIKIGDKADLSGVFNRNKIS